MIRILNLDPLEQNLIIIVNGSLGFQCFSITGDIVISVYIAKTFLEMKF